MKKDDLFSGSKLIAKRAFSLNGRRYQVGEEFNPAGRAITSRRVRQLFDANWIMLASAMDKKPVKATEPPVAPKPKVVPVSAVKNPAKKDS